MRQLNVDKLNTTLENRLRADIEWGRMAGAAIMVSQCGEIVSDIKMGTCDVRTGEPLKPGAIFRLASMTKPVTGVACLIGMEKGWFDLDDRVADYFPEVSNMWVGRLENGNVVPDHPQKSDIRICQLLSHSNGIMASNELGAAQEDCMPASAYETNAAMVDYCLHNTCLCFDPGEATAYSGYAAFDVLARILEEKSGMCYADFLDEYIFRPLGIRDITFRPTQEQWSRMVTMSDASIGHGMKAVEMGEYIFESFPISYTCAGAGLAGSIEDYRIFAEMLRGRGEYRGVRIVSPESIERMKGCYTPEKLITPETMNVWGLGVRVVHPHNPVLPAGSFGWSGAYGTHFWVDHENEITAIIMKNNRWYDSHGAGKSGGQFEKDVMSALEA